MKGFQTLRWPHAQMSRKLRPLSMLFHRSGSGLARYFVEVETEEILLVPIATHYRFK
jgi:hypothetical protein